MRCAARCWKADWRGLDVEALLGGKVGTTAKPADVDAEEFASKQAATAGKIKAEYAQLKERLGPVIGVLVDAFWETEPAPDGEAQAEESGEGKLRDERAYSP
jgi:hypothetical protein